jgi:hypothetical protein
MNRRYLDKDLLTHLIVHRFDTQEENNLKILSEIKHKRASDGYSDMGFHFIVFPDGSVMDPIDTHLVGTHTYGYDDTTLGCLVVRRMEDEKINEKQAESLRKIARDCSELSSRIYTVDRKKFYGGRADNWLQIRGVLKCLKRK